MGLGSKTGCVNVRVLRNFSSISKLELAGRLARVTSIVLVHKTVTLKTRSKFLILDLGSCEVTLTKYTPVAR